MNVNDQHARINADRWPNIALVPQGRRIEVKARKAESEFAAICEKAGIQLFGDAPDVIVREDSLFKRIAAAGWLGVAESYMAGEWYAENLVDVLKKLIAVGYHPKMPKLDLGGDYSGMEVDTQLIKLFSGDGMSIQGTLFSSGVPTTERIAVRSYVKGAGRANEPATHFVDQTTLSDPTLVEKADLGAGQLRSTTALLDSAGVHAGTHLLDFPSSGGALAINACHRGATVDALTTDLDFATDIREILDLANVEGSAHVELIDDPIPAPKAWPTQYDVITSVEKLELMQPGMKKRYVQAIDRMLAVGGAFACQSVVLNEEKADIATAAMSVHKAYVWHAFSPMRLSDMHKLVDRFTNLRIISQTHFPGHYQAGLRLQRETFEGNIRQAAADGFDVVYRRLWIYQLAMREALFIAGVVDAVQCLATTRHRRGGR